ncbi:Autophagy-related protein [Melia azedarach]|uniref:Autophagy-related protein n=2 Tax=Melia azedarach TaxID=155640 RepID=A0ACC1YA18_MELAZ|nr:Autophagy-related protein [Melia azedarach]KAJ4720133.1 Autophagy-related protein [Melia azedarach]
MGSDSFNWPFILVILVILHRVNSVSAVCELSFKDSGKLYNYSLASPLAKFPHGVLGEDGFYKVEVNQTVLWFQLCDAMIFNHDRPRCADCLECGGPSRCGLECSALVANNLGGYPVCISLGRVNSTIINIMDIKNPQKGVVVKMSSIGPKHNCSLSVSVICDSNALRGPESMEKSGTCDYATVLWHPSGCGSSVAVHGGGWGWFGTFITIILCLFGSYLLIGTVYRCFFLGVHSLHALPNLDFWSSIPHRTQSFFASLVQKFRGPSEGHRSTYSRVNF